MTRERTGGERWKRVKERGRETRRERLEVNCARFMRCDFIKQRARHLMALHESPTPFVVPLTHSSDIARPMHGSSTAPSPPTPLARELALP